MTKENKKGESWRRGYQVAMREKETSKEKNKKDWEKEFEKLKNKYWSSVMLEGAWAEVYILLTQTAKEAKEEAWELIRETEKDLHKEFIEKAKQEERERILTMINSIPRITIDSHEYLELCDLQKALFKLSAKIKKYAI